MTDGPAPSPTPSAPPGAGRRAPFDIVCLSPQEWRVDLPTNRQQIMTRARQRGHGVVFVETGPWAARHLRSLLRGPNRRSLVRQLGRGETVEAGVRVVKAPTLLPWGHKYALAARVNARLTAWAVRRQVRRRAAPVVLWLYDPCFADCIGRSGERFAVYDCVDDYAEQTGGDARKHALVTAYDALAAARARLVFATARPLLERHLRHNPRTHLVRNVGDFEHFARAADGAPAAEELAGLPRPILGFVGNLMGTKVDFALLDALAERRPDWTIVLVGPTQGDAAPVVQGLTRRGNVRHVPGRPYEEIPSYVAAFDVALIPYVDNAYTRSCFPLKTFEYLAAGKPIVASGLPELRELAPHVALVDGPEELLTSVDDALSRRSPEHVAARQRVAAANTWETRTERLLELVRAELEPSLPISGLATTLSR